VSATALSSSAIRLSWQDNSNNESGFRIDRWNGTQWVVLGYAGANATSYTDSGLQPNTTYYYYVGSYNSAGVSWASNYVYATTQGGGRSEVVVDDLDGGFQRFGPSQYWWGVNIGYNGHMFWTWNETSTTSNWARWTPNLAGGNYEVYAFIPRDKATTANARYIIHYAGGSTQRSVNQNNYYDAWVSLGTYNFSSGSQGYVDLGDATGESSGSRYVGFDAIKFVPR
jgi:hypothetical protein